MDRIADRLRTARWVVPALFGLALGLRLLVILLLPQTPYSDGQWYLVRAGEMADGFGYQEAGHPTAFWPVGYPALLAASMVVFGHGLAGPLLVNLLAVAVTIALILWFGRTLAGDPLAGRVGALLYALYPAHIVYAGQTVSETAAGAVAMAATALMIAGRRRWPMMAAAGVFFGLGTLMRAQLMLFPAGAIVGLMLAYREVRWRDAARAAVAVYLPLVATVAPWTIRNEVRMHAFVPVSTNGGVALFTGANDLATGDWFVWERTPLWNVCGVPYAQRVERQVEMDRGFRAAAKRWIAAHPARWTALGFKKMALLWRKDSDAFWSLDHSYPAAGRWWMALQAADQLYYLVLLGLATAALWVGARAVVRREEEQAPIALLGLMPAFATLTAFGFTGQIRYHHPAMPFLAVAAGWTLARLAERGRLSHPSPTGRGRGPLGASRVGG